MAIVTRTARDGKPRYDVVVYMPDPVTGRRKQKWFRGFTTKKAAEAKEAELKLAASKGETWQPTLTLREFLTMWLEGVQYRVETGSAAPSTLKRYGEHARSVIAVLGDVRLNQLAAGHIEALHRELSRQGRDPNTVRHCHTVLHIALKDAWRRGLIAQNVTEKVQPPARRRPEVRALTAEEARALLAAAASESTRYHALITLALATGLREGELLGLRWEDVDLKNGSLFVRQALKQPGRNPVFGPVKTHRSKRPVALGRGTVAVLRRWRAEQAEWRLLAGDRWHDFDLVFTTELGGPLSPRHIASLVFKRLARKAGIDPAGVRFHGLRHTFATLSLAAGVPVHVVKEALGHANIGTTLDIYADYVRERHEEAASRVEEAIFPAMR